VQCSSQVPPPDAGFVEARCNSCNRQVTTHVMKQEILLDEARPELSRITSQ